VSKGWAGGSTTAWRRVRAFVLNRDLHRCRAHADRLCDRKPGEHTCTGVGDQAHHVHGKKYGDDPAFIVAACKPCNLHIGEPDASDPPGRSMTKW
jgi:hypothetical protein